MGFSFIDILKKKRAKLTDDVTYKNHPEEYDKWVSHYNIKEITSYLNGFSFGESILECGCGTGLFSLYLSEKADKLTCVDINMPMLAILQKKIQVNSLRNITAISDDAELFLSKCNRFDTVFFSFSLDNIAGIEVGSFTNNFDRYISIIKNVNEKLNDNGICIITGSMPVKSDNIGEKSCMIVRKRQIEILSEMKDFEWKEFEINISFDSQKEAIALASLFFGKERAKLMYTDNSFNWPVFVVSFKKTI